jgi:bacillithiol biosynthesis cysteine-adding enzyme BshC
MKPSCLRHTSIPGTSRLFGDFLYNFDRVADFYDWNPFDPQSFQDAAEAIEYPANRRAALVKVLARQNPGAPSLELLAKPSTVAVVTGQQVGLFSGPAYTVFKAITTARLAKQLNESGIPAVPIFWLATEDHDLAEVDHAWTYNKSGEPVKLQSLVGPTHGPVGEARFSEVPLEELKTALAEFPYGSEVIAMVERAYRPGETLGTSFRTLIAELLRDLGLLFLDPLDPAIRQIAAPFLQKAVSRTQRLMNGLRERNAQLESAGYHAQVHVDGETSPVFLLEGGRRIPLKLQNGKFVAKNRSFTPEELAQRAGDISPNALLRPVMQDYLLPTVAYVGGPAEAAYMAQSQVLYRDLLGRMPVIFPRNGFTLLGARAEKLMERYHLEVQDVLDYEERVHARIASQLIPQSVKEAFASAKRTAEQELARLRKELAGFDFTLEAAAQKSGSKILYQLEKLERKASRETLHRDKQAERDAAYLTNLIYPRKHLQERFYTILPFIAEHGPDLIRQLLEAAHTDCPDHMLRRISELPALVYSD